MNPLVRHIASGDAFFTGSLAIILAMILRPFANRRPVRFALTLAALLGLAFAVLSATPLPWWFYGIAGTLAVASLAIDRGVPCGALAPHVLSDSRSESDTAESSTRSDLRHPKTSNVRNRLSPMVRWAAVAAWCVGMAWELPHHVIPRIPVSPAKTLFVIGDSVSAGLNEGETTWPAILAAKYSLDVRDCSHIGATAESAMKQAERVDGPGLVLVEIGGNDVLGPVGGTPYAEFETQLDTLLQRLSGNDRIVVMLELPLPPLANEYGAIQRRVSRRHGVLLIPKHMFLGVLTNGGATVDSIHLSRKGQELMAETIWRIVGPSLQAGGMER